MYAHTNPMIFSHLHITSMIKIRFREDGGSSFEKQLKADTFTGKVPGREVYCFAFWSDEDAKEKTPRISQIIGSKKIHSLRIEIMSCLAS